MLKAKYIQHDLIFRQAAGTSRGVLHTKESWFILLYDSDFPDKIGIGECSLIPGLSPDPRGSYENELDWICNHIERYSEWMKQVTKTFPSIAFGLETALRDLHQGAKRVLFDNDFTKGLKSIPINGLVWMGTAPHMSAQIKTKIDAGFDCIKIKVGAIKFEEELSLIAGLREQFNAKTITIRLDANGAFKSDDVIEKLNRLSDYEIHSIEQPIKQGQLELMAEVCEKSPIAIALDEELIGVYGANEQTQLLNQIKPHFIILKPSLLGGFQQSDAWIEIANERGIGWWITSALESNFGLNAIAQWTSQKQIRMPQGLGTGQLFTNNFDSPLEIKKGELFYNPQLDWKLENLKL